METMSDLRVIRVTDKEWTTVAHPIFPRPVTKHAVLVPIPKSEDGTEIPTFIRPGWGGVQVFYGDYYAFIKDGKVDYGSAKEQWLNMHTELAPGYWVKTAIPTAYQATEPCKLVTWIPSNDGGIRETPYILSIGDWVVKQPGNEIQHVKAAKFEGIYFTSAEAAQKGLTSMSAAQFAEWAITQCRALVPAV